MTNISGQLASQRSTAQARARYAALASILTLLHPEDLTLLGLSGAVMNDVAFLRRDDDFYGTGAAALGLLLSLHTDMTPTDRTVVSNVLARAGGAIAQGAAFTPQYLGKFDPMEDRSISEKVAQWVTKLVSGDVTPDKMGPGAVAEAVSQMLAYMSQYNRDVSLDGFKIFFSVDNAKDTTGLNFAGSSNY